MSEMDAYELAEVPEIEAALDKRLVVEHDCCPLCGRSGRKWEKGKYLYNSKVCRKCYYGFANRRQIAYVVDSVVYYLFVLSLFFGIGVLAALVEPAGSTFDESVWFMVLLVVFGLAATIIFTFRDGFFGYSPGKWLFGVRVIDQETGEPIGFGKSFRRNIKVAAYGLLLGFIPYVGRLATFFFYITVGTKLCNGPRLGDESAGTKVIWKKYAHHQIFVDSTVCDSCGYDLRVTTTDACPECGAEISRRKRQVITEKYGLLGERM